MIRRSLLDSNVSNIFNIESPYNVLCHFLSKIMLEDRDLAACAQKSTNTQIYIKYDYLYEDRKNKRYLKLPSKNVQLDEYSMIQSCICNIQTPTYRIFLEGYNIQIVGCTKKVKKSFLCKISFAM